MTERIVNYLDELFPDPKCELNYNKDYELVIATMLSAQTTDKRVNMVTEKLFSLYPDLYSLSKANINDIITLVRPLGSYHKKSGNVIGIAERLLTDKNGIVPNDREYLETLPGVGRKTANVVLSNLFNEAVIAVDTHVARVSVRLKIAANKDDVLTIERKLNKKFTKEELGRLHHQMVLFGRYYCKAKNPLCDSCKLKDICREKKVKYTKKI